MIVIKMSEKRFQKGMNLSCVDAEAGKSYWYACNLCGLLNEQQKEIDDLKEENEQLRQQVQNAKEIAVKNDMQYQICRKEKEDFQDMCEQLRKELDNFKPVMFQDMRKGTVILYSKG